MKKLIFIILFLPIQLYAQYESVFGDTSTKWHILHVINDGFLTDSQYVVKDSVVNDHSYKYIESGEYSGAWFLRESMDNSIVYYLNPTLSEDEYIVMDMNLLKSDTFKIGINGEYELIVDSVYSVGGRKHIRFGNNISPPISVEQFMFIEGVGSNFGLFYQGIHIEDVYMDNYLLCSHKDGILEYVNLSPYADCFAEWNIVKNYDYETTLLLYPNPASNYVTLRFTNIEIYKSDISIHDSRGRLIKSVCDFEEGDLIDLQLLSEGIYYLTITSDNIQSCKKLLLIR